MSTRIKNLILATLLPGAIAVPVSHATAATCESLSGLSLSEVVSIEAKSFPGGTFQPPNPSGFVPTVTQPFVSAPIAGLPAFCEVSIVVAPQINIEVWLPLAGAWNHRFKGVGGGGYAGTISWSALATALEAGFATASTDTGHSAFAPNNGASGGGFALNQPADTLNWGLIVDFAQRSEHQLAVKAKAAIEAFFDEAPVFSYWTGCSTGGRQGWIEAQRHPNDYDGILAGAPAMNWDRFIPAELWPQIVMHEEVGAPIAASKLNAATSAAIAACVGKDGGLATDAYLSDPRLCRFDPTVNPAAVGLTATEAGAIKKIWDGPRNGRGERVWFGLAPGTPLAALAGSSPFPIAQDHFVYWLHQNPAFDWHTVTESSFFTDFHKSEVLFENVVGTDRSNLNGFIRHGTKLIGYHGWADVLIFPAGSGRPGYGRLLSTVHGSRHGSLRRRHRSQRFRQRSSSSRRCSARCFYRAPAVGRAWGCARAVHSNQVRQQQSSERSRIYPAAVQVSAGGALLGYRRNHGRGELELCGPAGKPSHRGSRPGSPGPRRSRQQRQSRPR